MSALLSLLELLIVAILGGRYFSVWSPGQVGELASEACRVPASRDRRAPQEPRGP